ncbi:unnamed protein product [Protopolystoma xenopodis]|uniref:Uncharacterized protein n=1 Tax=Protopolystoma xenopodis TaxID=117903 RepID=A0A3S5CCC7_9PLAT|nr:unnamed protein product [Protopolystoma xenopodis]
MVDLLKASNVELSWENILIRIGYPGSRAKSTTKPPLRFFGCPPLSRLHQKLPVQRRDLTDAATVCCFVCSSCSSYSNSSPSITFSSFASSSCLSSLPVSSTPSTLPEVGRSTRLVDSIEPISNEIGASFKWPLTNSDSGPSYDISISTRDDQTNDIQPEEVELSCSRWKTWEGSCRGGYFSKCLHRHSHCHHRYYYHHHYHLLLRSNCFLHQPRIPGLDSPFVQPLPCHHDHQIRSKDYTSQSQAAEATFVRSRKALCYTCQSNSNSQLLLPALFNCCHAGFKSSHCCSPSWLSSHSPSPSPSSSSSRSTSPPPSYVFAAPVPLSLDTSNDEGNGATAWPPCKRLAALLPSIQPYPDLPPSGMSNGAFSTLFQASVDQQGASGSGRKFGCDNDLVRSAEYTALVADLGLVLDLNQ